MESNICCTACAACASFAAPAGWAPVVVICLRTPLWVALPGRALGCLRQHVVHCAFEFRRGYIFDHAGIANADGQNKPSYSADVLFVAAGRGTHFSCLQRERRQRAVQMDQILEPVELAGGDGAALMRQEQSRDHAPANGFAMQQGFVAGGLLERVADRVTEIENHAEAIFAFVAMDDTGLHTDGRDNHLFERLGIAAQTLVDVLFHEADQAAVADDACLYAFHQAGAEFAARQGSQNGDISEYGEGMVEAAHEGLTLGQNYA